MKRLAISLWMLSLGLWSCNPTGGPSSGVSGVSGDSYERLVAEAQAESASNPAKINLELAPPEALVADRVRPLQGMELEAANQPLAEVIKGLTRPTYVSETPVGKSPAAADSRRASPRAAIRAYVDGQIAYRQGNPFEAIQLLERAMQLDPQSIDAARMLGIMQVELGRKPRGAVYLKQTLAQRPDDSTSLFLLGRMAAERQQWDEAIHALARAVEVESSDQRTDADAAVLMLGRYYLGQALFQLKKDGAAVEQMKAFLEMDPSQVRLRLLYQELAALSRGRDSVRLLTADGLIRLGKIEESLAACQQLASEPESDMDALLPRLAYLNMMLGRPATAQKLAIDRLGKSSNPTTLATVAYLAGHAPDRARFIEQLKRVYREGGRTAELAAAVESLLDAKESADFLAEHLNSSGGDLTTFRRYIERSGSKDRPATMRLVIKLIDARMDLADQYMQALVAEDDSSAEWHTAFDSLAEKERTSAAGWFVDGQLLQMDGDLDGALDSYAKAAGADAKFVLPLQLMVNIHVAQKRVDQAQALLKKLEDRQDDEIRLFRANAYAAMGKLDLAMGQVDALLAAKPRDPKFLLYKGRLQLIKGEKYEAERTLRAVLEAEPTNEEAYEELFEIYEKSGTMFPNRFAQLLGQARQTIPSSRVTRMKSVRYFIASRDMQRAEQILRELIRETPSDGEAVAFLGEIIALQEEFGRAYDFLKAHFERHPSESFPIGVFGRLSMQVMKEEEFFKLVEGYLKGRKPTATNLERLAIFYASQMKDDQAAATIEQAIGAGGRGTDRLRRLLAEFSLRAKKYDKAMAQVELLIGHEKSPQEKADLLYFKVGLLQAMKKRPEAEKVLEELLSVDPDHASANNDLAYTWTDRGVNLDRAEKMIEKALKTKPNSHMYLDTLGWLLYKQGRFEEAAKRLREALQQEEGKDDPVILDHFGDALWRIGRKAQARSYWEAAGKMAADEENKEREDAIEVLKQVKLKIKAAEDGQEPPVAPTAAEAGPKQAGALREKGEK